MSTTFLLDFSILIVYSARHAIKRRHHMTTRIDKTNEIKELLKRKLSRSEIAAQLNVSETTVTNYRKKLGVANKTTKKLTEDESDKIKTLILESKLSRCEIAARLGIHASTVTNYRKKLGIEPMRKKQVGKRKYDRELIIALLKDLKTAYEIAETMGCSHTLVTSVRAAYLKEKRKDENNC